MGSEREIEILRDALERISNWRRDSRAYTDSMNLPPRKMDESQVIHIEGEARAALRSTASQEAKDE